MNYQGVIAISYTRKASANLKQRSLADGVWSKNSFFGTIDSFCLTQIILPFGNFVMGYPKHNIETVRYIELTDEQKVDFAWITQRHPPYEDINESAWSLLCNFYTEGKVLVESLGLLALHLLKQCPACRKFVKARFKYVFIDEYQDADEYTNGVLLELIGLGLITNVVGDVNQSIFGFAHKSSEYLSAIERRADFTSFRLADNFRCSAPIVNYSNRLMDPDCALIDTNEEGIELIKVDGAEDGLAEYIDSYIDEDCRKYQVDNIGKVAILVKSKKTQKLIDQNLQTRHRVIESTVLDEDLNPRSRLYGMLLQFYLDTTMRFLSIIDEFVEYDDLSEFDRKLLMQLSDEIRSVGEDEFEDELPGLFKSAGDVLLRKYGEGSATLNLKTVLGNQQMLDTYRPVMEDEALIMTLHKAKGLEFDIVYHLNMNQWELPYKKIENGDFDNPQYPSWEQDLDLHYVGVTRARKACILLTSSKRHNSQGEIKKSSPSEFLNLNGVEQLRRDYTYKSK